MRVFLVETTTHGHHLSYLRLFAKAFNELKHDLTIISPATYQEVLDDNFEEGSNKIEVRTIKEGLPDFQGGGILAFRKHIRHTWTWFKKVVDDAAEGTNNIPDLVFFAMIDPYIGPYTSKYEIDNFFPYPWTGLYMKPQNILKKWKYSLLRRFVLNPNHILQSAKCRAIGIFINPCADELFRVIRKPVVTFPDIVDKSEPDLTANIVTDIIREAKGRKIISLLGSLEQRKGIVTLLNAAKKLPTDKFFFVFAGELIKSSFSDSELSLINITNLPNGYFLLKRIPSEGIFNGIISISTIVYAAYVDFPFSSNMVGKAALFHRPLLVTSGSYMGAVVDTYKLGMSAKQGDVQDIQGKILNMTSDKYLSSFVANNRCDDYTQENSYLVFLEKLKHLLSYY